MCEAATLDAAVDPLNEMLNQLYRLSELAKRKHYGGDADLFYRALAGVTGGDAAAAALWARTFDVHHAFEVGESADVHSNYYTNLYGVVVWKQRSQLPPPNPKHKAYGRELLYDAHMAGLPVLDTTRTALLVLLPSPVRRMMANPTGAAETSGTARKYSNVSNRTGLDCAE